MSRQSRPICRSNNLLSVLDNLALGSVGAGGPKAPVQSGDQDKLCDSGSAEHLDKAEHKQREKDDQI